MIDGSGTFAGAALLMFFAYTGYEAIAVGAEDMENPKKNLPRAIIVVMLICTALYMLVLGISIGILGPSLAKSTAPIQDAFGKIIGPAASLLWLPLGPFLVSLSIYQLVSP